MRRRLGAILCAALVLAACTRLPQPEPAAYHGSDADVSITRIIHGSLIVALGGKRLLVDPWFYSGRLRRQSEPLGILPEGLPPLDAVVVTHGHGDHFDGSALADLAKRVPVAIAPGALAKELRRLGFRDVAPLEWWQRTALGDVTVTAVPARDAGSENGYLLRSPTHTVYVAGDSRVPDELAQIAAAAPGLDLAVLPIGGRRVMGMLTEMGPEQAAEAAGLLRPRRVVPVAYGASSGIPIVYWYARNPLERFERAAKQHGIARSRIVVLAPGESWHGWGSDDEGDVRSTARTGPGG
jgi:L-ascorbate metabolism protein UlaG (beta-lactamase superfamily)